MVHVSFIDSGIGGLAYCNAFLQNNLDVGVSYIADTLFFPYGTHEIDSIQQRLIDLCKVVIDACKPNIIVLACNTASVSALKLLRSVYTKKKSVHFVGVVPAIKPVCQANGKRMYMMSSTTTTKNEYTDTLLQQFANDIYIYLRGFPELIESIEKMILFRSEAYSQYVASLLERIIIEIKELNIDSVVLACTHFLFIKKKLRQLLPKNIHIYHSLEGVIRQIGKIIHSFGQKVEKNNLYVPIAKTSHTITSVKKTQKPMLYITSIDREQEFKRYIQNSHYQYGGVIA